MRSNTQATTIATDPARVRAFVADPRNLPKWAIGFAKSVRPSDDGAGDTWVVDSPQGDVGLRVVTDEATGIVDYVMSPAPGIEVIAHSRVLPNGEGSEYVFTQLQPPGMPDEVFEHQVRTLTEELEVLAGLLGTRGSERSAA